MDGQLEPPILVSSAGSKVVEDFMGRICLVAGSALLALMIGSSAFAATPTAPQPGKACISAQDWATAVRDKSSGVAIRVLTDLGGLEAKQVMERVNAEPPKTRISADRLIVLGAQGDRDR